MVSFTLPIFMDIPLSGAGWYDLYYGGGSCNPSTSSANSVSGHPLAGVLCVYGTYVPPYQ